MDEDDTAGYREPCAVCAVVNWGISDEGRFYCMSCHNVIERTREVVDPHFDHGSSRVTTINKGLRTKKAERGYTWMVCEGFQFILKNQADALLRLGVAPHFKDEVLCQMWRRYLQKSRQAYVLNPVTRFRIKPPSVELDLDSTHDSSVMSATDRESNLPSSGGSDAETSSAWSGSVDSNTYLTARRRRSHSLMSMRKTLALIHLALVWSQEALTLSDLLRLVRDGSVPYINAYQQLPEEMKLYGKDALVFHTESVPSHHSVHKEAQGLVLFLQLPAFPPISSQNLLHPALLSLRYLIDANLPDELHRWVCRLMERVGLSDQKPHGVLPRYDVQAAALIVVTMKLVFGLDDCTEWDLSNEAGRDASGRLFSFRRWFRLVQAALIRAQQEEERDAARKQWKPKKPIILSKEKKCVVMKKKRITEQLQVCFEKLSSCAAGVQDVSPSSFRFCWGDEEGSDGPSLHHMKLDGVVTLTDGVLTPLSSSYWHTALRPCNKRMCFMRSHYLELEPTLPRTFVWLLQLFSFMLDVKPWYLFEEVLTVERVLTGASSPRPGTSTRIQTKKRLRSRSKDSVQTSQRNQQTDEVSEERSE